MSLAARSTEAANGEARIEPQSGLCGSTRLIQQPELRECDRKIEMREGEIAVGLDAAPEPSDRFAVGIQLNLGDADPHHPPEGEDISWREAEGLMDMGLGLLAAAEKILGETD